MDGSGQLLREVPSKKGEVMHYLVTGGAGFIGSHLTDRLLETGHRVTCFDNFDQFYSPILKWRNIEKASHRSMFKLVSGNITNSKELEKAFCDVEGVIHLAAQAGVRPSIQNAHLHFEVNVLGTINVLELCRKYGVKKVVYASSSSVYGNANGKFSEDMNVDKPLCPYAASKKAGELNCYTYHHLYGIDTAIIRPFTVYGPRQRTEMAIPLFTRLIDNGEVVTLFGDGTTKRDYTYVDDVVEGIVRLLHRKNGYEVFNLGTSNQTPVINLVEMIAESLCRPVQIEYKPMNTGEAENTFADITKAENLLGYSPKIRIGQGIGNYVTWYLREGKNAVQKAQTGIGGGDGETRDNLGRIYNYTSGTGNPRGHE
jgi:UDP-glucuronate 4-epimerase